MEQSKNYKKLYIKYKLRYLILKNANLHKMTGGSNEQSQIDFLINLKNQMRDIINNKPIVYETLQKLVNKFVKYLELNNIPFDYYGLSLDDIELFNNELNKMDSELTVVNLTKLYKLREYIYTIDENNMNDILDSIIIEFNINNENDIEKLFISSILGYNKNYVINYLVLFRYLIKNKKQLTLIDNNVSYLTFGSIFNTLDNSLNNEEYIPLLVKLIKEYINMFPIKKTLIIKNSADLEKEYKNEYSNINKYIDLINSYDIKNDIIIYKSGKIKDTSKIIFNDLKQIIYSLFRIPIKSN
jgi:hypothetical protein